MMNSARTETCDWDFKFVCLRQTIRIPVSDMSVTAAITNVIVPIREKCPTIALFNRISPK
jgi:hypothetical protein